MWSIWRFPIRALPNHPNFHRLFHEINHPALAGSAQGLGRAMLAAGGPAILRGNIVGLETGRDNQVTAVRVQQPLGVQGQGSWGSETSSGNGTRI